MSLTDRLRNEIKKRLSLKKSLLELAAISDVPYAVLWRFANGKRDIRLAAADRLWNRLFGWGNRRRVYFLVRDLIAEQMSDAGLGPSDFKKHPQTGMDEIDQLADKLVTPIIELVETEAAKEARRIKKKRAKLK